MRSKYCIKCGQAITSNANNCNNCQAEIIEMPISDAQSKFIEKQQRAYAENPPSKIKGCLITLAFMCFMFGIPALITFSGISLDSMIGISLIVLVFLILNFILYKHRQKLRFKKKQFYTLTQKTKEDFLHQSMKCRSCNQLLTIDMIFCPKCGLHVHEDIPVDLSKGKPILNTENRQAHDRSRSNKYCSNCASNVEGKKFCPECGTKTEVM